ncbi:MAG: hypothetical protein DWG76_00660 [Chloroflexi bacterium]|nr:hypothetical protein [Chloroflexota bacterium]MQC25948.1 hypothetical protein [Chloroflexota bacterium]
MKSLSILTLLATVSAIIMGALFAVTPVLAEASVDAPAQNPINNTVSATDPVAPTTGQQAELETETLVTVDETASEGVEVVAAAQDDLSQAPQTDAGQDVGEALSSAFTVSFEKEASPDQAVAAEASQELTSAQADSNSGSEPVQAVVAAQTIDALESFIQSVTNGKSNQVRGIYVDDVLAFAVGSQPSSNPGYITGNANEVTQFGMAADYGSLGLLAHNYLAGSDFFSLSNGQTIKLVYGDGSTASYRISSIHRYQALQPNSTQSTFVDLESGETLSATTLFHNMYNSNNPLVLQTCIANEGISTWGRVFIVAVPL